MTRKHSELMYLWFPNQSSTGYDLDNVEIKESTKAYHRFQVKKKDMDAEFFLCYDHDLHKFWFIRVEDLPQVRKKRDFRTTQIEPMALWKSESEIEMLNLIKPFLRNPEFHIPKVPVMMNETPSQESMQIEH